MYELKTVWRSLAEAIVTRESAEDNRSERGPGKWLVFQVCPLSAAEFRALPLKEGLIVWKGAVPAGKGL